MSFLFLSSSSHAAPAISHFHNGLTVITDQRPGSPVTAVQLWVRAGSIDETERTLGLSHFMEHMLFKGTTTRAPGSIHAEVENNGGDFNAATSEDWTYYHITIPSAQWEHALDILLDIAVNANFPDTEVERERPVIEEEIARRDDNPEALLFDNIGKAAYRIHPYQMRVIGSHETLARITRPVFLDYYRKHYRPENMAIVIVGDPDTGVIARKIAATLGRIPRARGSARVPRPVEPPSVPQRLSIPAHTSLEYGAVSYPAGSAGDVRMNAAADVLVEILAADGIGRLNKKLVESAKWADAISVSYPTMKDPSRFSIIYTASPEYRLVIEDEIRKEIRNLRIDARSRGSVSSAEVTAAVDRMRRARLLHMESSSSRAFNLGFWFAVGKPEDALAYDAIVDSIQPKDISEFVTRYLDESHAVTIEVEPSAPSGTGLSGAAISERLIRRRVSGNLVAVGFFIPGGQSIEPKPGWAALLAGLMNRGTEGKTHEDHERELAGAGISIAASSNADMFSLVGTAEPARVGLLVNSLFDILTNPNFSDIEIVREELLDNLRSRADQPFETALDKLIALRFPNHPYGRPDAGDERGLRDANTAELREMLSGLVRPDSMIITVVGPGDADDTSLNFAIAARTAAILRNRPDHSAASPPPIPVPPAHPGSVTETAPTSQVMVLRSIAAPMIGDPAYAAWKVANVILGGKSSSRLFRIIREQRGLAYAVGSFYPSRKLGSHLVIYAGTRPATADAVRDLLKKSSESFFSPTADELEDAKKLIIGEFALDHEQVSRRAWYLGWYKVLGLGPAYDAHYPEEIWRVSLADVSAVFDVIRSASDNDAINLTYGNVPLDAASR